MKKMISLFQRNYESDRLVRNEVMPGAEWVLNGEGVATRKLDGTCCKIEGGKLFKRYDLKAKKGRHAPPPNWEAAQPDPDPITTSWPGWLPVSDGSEDRWFREGFDSLTDKADGTYELLGPKVQGNPEGYDQHVLVPHGRDILEDVPRDFDGIREYLSTHNIEGIVWHHPDGRMVKIKGKDFGIKRQSFAQSEAV